jgi:predicted nucleotidyltransferase
MRAQKPGQSALLFLDVVEILQREHVDYAVIGAFALSVHGEVRGTMDVDAVLFTPQKRLTSLRETFEKEGFLAELRRGDHDDPIPAMLILRDAHENQVELLGGLKGMDPEVFARTVEVPFMGVSLRIVGREDFIAMKCFAGGPQDMVDARSAYRRAQEPVNIDLLRTVTRRFGRHAADKLEEVLAE